MSKVELLSSEDLHIVNRRLIDHYGMIENFPSFRLIWSEDQFEKRWMTHTDEGFVLINPEVREVPKYRTYIRDKYILEGLKAVPQFIENELVESLSYEPIWTFEDKNGNYLKPIWPAIHLILEQMRHNQESIGYGAKYKDPESDKEEAFEIKKQRLNELQSALFGNETEVSDALTYKEGIVVPHSYQSTTPLIKES